MPPHACLSPLRLIVGALRQQAGGAPRTTGGQSKRWFVSATCADRQPEGTSTADWFNY